MEIKSILVIIKDTELGFSKGEKLSINNEITEITIEKILLAQNNHLKIYLSSGKVLNYIGCSMYFEEV